MCGHSYGEYCTVPKNSLKIGIARIYLFVEQSNGLYTYFFDFLTASIFAKGLKISYVVLLDYLGGKLLNIFRHIALDF